jgi:DNA (cytosine-5)-methyltransferase 1
MAKNPRRMTPPSQLTSIELFTGAGGLALGVARAGFKHLALVELNRNAVASINGNRSRVAEMRDWPEDVAPTDVTGFDFRPYAGGVNLLAAGAPCQPFSLGGKHRGDTDPRNLFPAVFKAVRELGPEAVIVENVKGLLRTSFREYFEYIKLQLTYPHLTLADGEDWREHRDRLETATVVHSPSRPTYRVEHALLNAADYGLPQRRERVFIVALREDFKVTWRPPAPTHSEDALLYEKWVSGSYWKEHRLKMPPVPDSLRPRVERLRELGREKIKTDRWRTVRDALKGLPEPANKVEHKTVVNHVGNPGARVYPGHTGSPLDLPAKTLKAGDHGVPGGENMLVRDDGSVRYFTVREAARLQGFPDEYFFQGAWCEGFRQLGNAVPVDLAKAVAESVRDTVAAARRSSRVA